MDLRRADIVVEIDELVLHGFDPADRAGISVAVTAELAQLLTVQGIPSFLHSGADVERVASASFEVPPASRPGQVGERIGRAVYEGIAR